MSHAQIDNMLIVTNYLLYHHILLYIDTHHLFIFVKHKGKHLTIKINLHNDKKAADISA